MSSRYGDESRAWAEKTFTETRHQYNSRLECCHAIAKVLGAHVNTVSRWIGETYGPARQAAPEEVTAKLRALEEEVVRLRRQNHDLTAGRGFSGRNVGLA
ncbi:transposase [Rhodococcus sp. SRB_17]|nr:transposase [Rhodococcus sp. SRB_17]